MSISTWKKEFYPKPASKTTIAEALDHSIQKWTGYLDENLKKHGLCRKGSELFSKNDISGSVFSADITRCALCQQFMVNTNANPSIINCKECPLFKSTGKYCDTPHESDVYSRVVVGDESPAVMIRALEKARAFVPKE